jgi:hypothetical protein
MAKRARELGVKERRHRKRAWKADAAQVPGPGAAATTETAPHPTATEAAVP